MSAPIHDIFLAFGDSITQGGWDPSQDGFGTRLSHAYARKLDVLNRGLSGYNTKWAIPALKQIVAKKSDVNTPNIRIMTIWFGANDACLQQSPQHVPLADFKTNLQQMIDLIKSPKSPHSSPATRIILISPPPVNTIVRRADLGSRNPPLELDRDFGVTETYAKAVGEVASENKLAFVDVWTALWEAAGKEEAELGKFLYDGLHLNGAGYAIMYDALVATISKEHPEVHYDRLPFVFPPWAEIDWENPEESIRVDK